MWLLQTRETNYLLNCLLFEQQLSHVHLYKGPSDSSSQGLLSCLWLLLSFLDNKEERIWTITKKKKEKKNLSFLRCQSCKNSEAFVTVKTKWFVEYIILKLSREGNGRTKRLSQQRISHFFFYPLCWKLKSISAWLHILISGNTDNYDSIKMYI